MPVKIGGSSTISNRRKSAAKSKSAPAKTTRTKANGTKVTRTKTSAVATPASKTKAKDAELSSWMKKLHAQGERRRKAHEAYKAEVEATLELAHEANSAGVAWTKIASEDGLGISRQWIYNSRNFRGRDENGNGGNKSAAKKAAKAAVQSASKTGRGKASTSAKSSAKSGRKIRVKRSS